MSSCRIYGQAKNILDNHFIIIYSYFMAMRVFKRSRNMDYSFSGKVIENDQRFYVEIPFDLDEKKEVFSVRGMIGNVYFQRKIIKGDGNHYYIPVAKSTLKKNGMSAVVEVKFEIIDNRKVLHETESGHFLEIMGNECHIDMGHWADTYYNMIFKRKSFHIFKAQQLLAYENLRRIEAQIKQLNPLTEGIQTAVRIIPREQTNCPRGEYCILFYSEMKKHYLENIGYMGEQLDLWLADNNIGACWYGMGKTEETNCQGLPFVIMIAIEKVSEQEFRVDYTKAKRKSIEEIWKGRYLSNVSDVVRYAPSACNTQPWLVKNEKNRLTVFRVRGKRGIMPTEKRAVLSVFRTAPIADRHGKFLFGKIYEGIKMIAHFFPFSQQFIQDF